MFKTLLYTAIIVLAASAGAPASSEPLNVVASNWTFTTPEKIVLHVGTPTTFRFTSKEGVHGAVSEGLGIPNTVLIPGKPMTVVVTPKKAGVYKIICSVPCGSGHADMVLTVVVEP
jgi:cytochrome c oxidase subunit 2